MDSTLKGLTSTLPALAVFAGFLLVMFGMNDGTFALVQGGWGLVTVGVIVEFVLPISRRLR